MGMASTVGSATAAWRAAACSCRVQMDTGCRRRMLDAALARYYATQPVPPTQETVHT